MATAIEKCVHCGFCLAACPTYSLLGEEMDSPRGRIYLMKNVLEERLDALKTRSPISTAASAAWLVCPPAPPASNMATCW